MAGNALKAKDWPGFCRLETGGTPPDVAATVVASSAKNWPWKPLKEQEM